MLFKHTLQMPFNLKKNTFSFNVHGFHLSFVYVHVGSDWEVCTPGCLFAHVHCAREV